jgi:hypothetical protein
MKLTLIRKSRHIHSDLAQNNCRTFTNRFTDRNDTPMHGKDVDCVETKLTCSSIILSIDKIRTTRKILIHKSKH